MVSEQIKSLLMWEFMTENYTVAQILHANFYRFVTIHTEHNVCKEIIAVLKLYIEVSVFVHISGFV